jgi:hypothetical protein
MGREWRVEEIVVIFEHCPESTIVGSFQSPAHEPVVFIGPPVPEAVMFCFQSSTWSQINRHPRVEVVSGGILGVSIMLMPYEMFWRIISVKT